MAGDTYLTRRLFGRGMDENGDLAAPDMSIPSADGLQMLAPLVLVAKLITFSDRVI